MTPIGAVGITRLMCARTGISWPFVETGSFPEIASDCWDGYCAAIVAETGVTALKTGTKQAVEMIAKPEFYA